MQYSWWDLVGNIGVFLIVGAYLWLQLERISSTSLMYSAANALGALLILVSLIEKFNFSAFLIEAFWLLISLFGMMKAWSKKA
ncbi:MAG: hypothetical protein AAF438_12945 [Pseudomonadota bacterium]